MAKIRQAEQEAEEQEVETEEDDGSKNKAGWRARDDIEIVVDDEEQVAAETEEEVPEEFKNVSKADIIKKMEELKQKSATDASLQAGLKNLGDQMASLRVPQPMQARQLVPPEQEEKERERLEELIASRPIEGITELVGKKILPAALQKVSTGKMMARYMLSNDAVRGPTFKRYAQEIDALVASLPIESQNDPNAYEMAYNQIVGYKLKEVTDEAVEREIEKRVKEGKLSLPKAAEAQYSESGKNQPGGVATSKKTVRFTTSEWEEIKRRAVRSTMDPEDYALYKWPKERDAWKGGK